MVIISSILTRNLLEIIDFFSWQEYTFYPLCSTLYGNMEQTSNQDIDNTSYWFNLKLEFVNSCTTDSWYFKHSLFSAIRYNTFQPTNYLNRQSCEQISRMRTEHDIWYIDVVGVEGLWCMGMSEWCKYFTEIYHSSWEAALGKEGQAGHST